MKNFNVVFGIIAIFVSLFIWNCDTSDTYSDDEKSETETLPDQKYLCGYEIKGDSVIFYFDESIYAGQIIDSVDTVTVVGQFQGWDPTAADWHATKGEGGLWTLESNKSICFCGSKFKFVVNDIDWMLPDSERIDSKYLAADGFGTYNLVLVCE